MNEFLPGEIVNVSLPWVVDEKYLRIILQHNLWSYYTESLDGYRKHVVMADCLSKLSPLEQLELQTDD